MNAIRLSPLPPLVSVPGCPAAYAGQPFPYNRLDDRRFEELVFQLFRRKIERESSFGARHTRIQLMQGVGEKGRDAALFDGSRFSGAIQCKNYQSPLGEQECLKELIKLLFHEAVGNLSISSPTQFDYYFVASSGFGEKANKMFDDLAGYVDSKEANITKAVTQLKKEYAAFKNVDYTKIRDRLLLLLKSIRVHQYWPSDLERELLESGSESIQCAFFEVRTVTDNSIVKELNEKFDARHKISTQTVLEKFEVASLQLTDYPSTLHDPAHSHISRTETEQVVTWVCSSELKEEPVLLLVGDPGSGKTVILKDVYQALHKAQVPVVAFKADRYYVDSIQDFQRKADLPASLKESVFALLQEHKKVIVIIDQIDALSQSVTSKRDYVDTYGQLIHQLKQMNGVRIVVSIRKFELAYDDEFAPYRKYKEVPVQPLSKPEVVTVLAGLGIPESSLSDKLYLLLSVPNQLDIFCKVHAKAQNPTSITTLQELYVELWRQRVTEAPKTKHSPEQTLFALATELHRQQILSLSKKVFSESDALEDVIRTGLVVEQTGYVQFFHQTFFDFVFAKAFLARGLSVETYLRQNSQNIFIRPSVKMILEFLRTQNHVKYIRLIRRLLFSRWVRWHIKSLVINLLSFEQRPSKEEIDLVENKILGHSNFRTLFLEAVRGGGWLQVLIDNGTMNQLLQPKQNWKTRLLNSRFGKRISKINWGPLQKRLSNQNIQPIRIWSNILWSNLPENRHLVLKYLATTPDFEGKAAEILHLVRLIKVWDNDLAKTLFLESAKAANLEYQVDLLEDIADYDPQWVLDTLWTTILPLVITTEEKNSSMFYYHLQELGKKLIEKIPIAVFEVALKAVRLCLSKADAKHAFITTSGLTSEWLFEFFDYDRSEHSYGKDWFLHMAIATAEELCKAKDPAFAAFLQTLLSENSSTIIRIGLAGLSETPEHYPNEAFALLQRLVPLAGELDSHILFHLRNLLPRLFAVLNAQQQEVICNSILNLKIRTENIVREWEGKRRHFSHYGHTAYNLIAAIPESDRNKFPELKKKYQELERRFGVVEENKPPHRMRMYSVGAPLPAKAYQVMTLDEWEDSFRRYDQNYEPEFSSHKGGMSENATVFTTAVSEKPDYFLPLIQKIIDEDTVYISYQIAGLEGLKKVDFDPQLFLQLYKKLIERPLSQSALHRLLWLSEYLAKQELVDETVFQFLLTTALQSSEPEQYPNPDHPQSDAVNTLKGTAVYHLAYCSYKEEFAKPVLDVLDIIAESGAAPVRVSALMHLAYYLQWDAARVKTLFTKLVKPSDHQDVYQAGIYTAQYLAKQDFAATAPFLKAALIHEPCRKNASIILGVAFLMHKEGSLPILQEGWKLYPETRAAMVDVALANLTDKDPETRKKATWLYTNFLTDTDKDTVHEYSTAFLRLEAADFTRLFPLLKKYARSPVGAKGPGYFFEYLLKCCKEHPRECIDLLSPLVHYEAPDVSSSRYYERDIPVKVLMAAYNSLSAEPVKNRIYLAQALQLFDRLLRHPIFRRTAEQVLETV